MFSSASSTVKRGSTPRNTDVSPWAMWRSSSSVGSLVALRIAAARFTAIVVQPTPPLPPTMANDRPRMPLVETGRVTRCTAASRSAAATGSGSHSVIPSRIASSMARGSSVLASTTKPAAG